MRALPAFGSLLAVTLAASWYQGCGGGGGGGGGAAAAPAAAKPSPSPSPSPTPSPSPSPSSAPPPPPPPPPPPSGPAPVLTAARFLDADASGTLTSGDRVRLQFDLAVQVQGADPTRDLVLLPGDTAGAGASLQPGPQPEQLDLVLGTGAVLSLTGTFRPGEAGGAGKTPARVGLAAGALATAITSTTGVGARLGDPALLILLADPVAWPAYQGVAHASPAPAAALPYQGNLHAHTGLSLDTSSPGNVPPVDAWTYARDTAGISFMAVSDHLEHLDATEFAQMQTDAANSQRATFVALAGFEWGHGRDPGNVAYDHVNVIGTSKLVGLTASATLAGFYSEVLRLCYPEGAVGMWNHPSFGPRFSLNNWDDFMPYDAQVDKLMTLVHAEGAGSAETPALAWIPALDLGWHVSPAGGQDNHQGEWGNKTSRRVGVWLDELTPAALLRALREGRTYTSSDRNAAARLLAGGRWMGSTVADAGPVTLRVEWSDPDNENASRVDIVSNGGVVVSTQAVTGASGFVEVSVDPPVDSWYYALVRQSDGGELLTGPIYVDR